MTISPTAVQTMDPATRTLTVTLTNLTEGESRYQATTLCRAHSMLLFIALFATCSWKSYSEKCTNCPRVASYVHDAMNH